MRRLRFLFTAVAAFASGPALAGCINYEDGSLSGPAPRFEICYGDACDVSTLEYECSNAGSYQLGFRIGWAKFCTLEDGVSNCEILWRYRAIDPSKHEFLSCRSLDDDAPCGFP